jgi:hypothetical protein
MFLLALKPGFRTNALWTNSFFNVALFASIDNAFAAQVVSGKLLYSDKIVLLKYLYRDHTSIQ